MSGVNYDELESWFSDRAELKSTGITEQFNLEDWREDNEGRGIPLFTVAESGVVRVCGSDVTTSTKPGETLIGLVRAEEVGPADEEGAEEETDAPIPEAQYD